MKQKAKQAEPETVRVTVVMPIELWKAARMHQGIGTRGLTGILVKLLRTYLKGAK